MKKTVSVAPMMDCTDKHEIYFLSLISKNIHLYSEMIVANAIIRGDRDKLLSFKKISNPVTLQVGGSNPDELAERVKSVLIEGPVVPIPGSYYVFRYMAKTPEIRFDLNPLVQITEVFSYGFIAYNFHWGRNRRYTYPEVQGGLYQVTADELKDLELIPFQNFQMKPPK